MKEQSNVWGFACFDHQDKWMISHENYIITTQKWMAFIWTWGLLGSALSSNGTAFFDCVSRWPTLVFKQIAGSSGYPPKPENKKPNKTGRRPFETWKICSVSLKRCRTIAWSWTGWDDRDPQPTYGQMFFQSLKTSRFLDDIMGSIKSIPRSYARNNELWSPIDVISSPHFFFQ